MGNGSWGNKIGQKPSLSVLYLFDTSFKTVYILLLKLSRKLLTVFELIYILYNETRRSGAGTLWPGLLEHSWHSLCPHLSLLPLEGGVSALTGDTEEGAERRGPALSELPFRLACQQKLRPFHCH